VKLVAERWAEAFVGGWFHSGDLAVVHADGYMKIKDQLDSDSTAARQLLKEITSNPKEF